MEYRAEDLDSLQEAAFQILADFPDERVFTLEGEMGAGKTALVKAFCHALGVEENVSSPTFAIVHEYEGREGPVYHFDLYRLQQTGDLVQIGFDTYVDSGDHCFIEWPEKALPLMPDKWVEISIERRRDTNTRYIHCRSVSNIV